MSTLATVAATGVSLAAIAALAVRDPKRRRAFRLPPAEQSGGQAGGRLLWALVWLPGVVVPFASGGAGFVIWMGAVSVAGWVVAALPPGRVRAWFGQARTALPSLPLPSRAAIAAPFARLRTALAGRTGAVLRSDAGAAAATGLEGRVRTLQVELAALRQQIALAARDAAEASDAGGGVIVELSGRR